MLEEAFEGTTYRHAAQRQARLLEHLRAEVFVDVGVLREALGVSLATVRRDLTELEARGLLRRTHGGAALTNQVTRDDANAVRAATNAAEKARIAEAAAATVVEGDAVLVDSGTTALEVAKRLAGDPSLTFITNGADTLAALVAGGARRIHVVGGAYHDINHSFAGPLAAETVRRFNVDKAFLSVSSVDLRRGTIGTQSPELACVQAAMIEIAQTAIVVADGSKFGRTSLCVIASLDRVHAVVTDETARPHTASAPERIRRKLVFA